MTIPTIDLVREWHELFGVPVLSFPCVPNAERCELRERLLREELDEFADAVATGDIAEILQELMDLQYVLDGTLLEFGLYEFKDAGFAEVHRANMSKVGSDGNPIKREDGKVLKGPYFTAPDLQAVLDGDNDTEE